MKSKLLLPLVMLALAGCHSDAFYQEKAVESARQFIYTHARELTPEQIAFVKMTPPVLLSGTIFERSTPSETTLPGGEKCQICITWKIPEKNSAYMVFGMSEPRMAFWKPLRLIRRPLGKTSTAAEAALNQARKYAVTALEQQMSFADLNIIRFQAPQAAITSFKLASADDHCPNKVCPRPWGKTVTADLKSGEQLSLLWPISGGRFAVFCGMGKRDLANWQIAMAGIMDAGEVKKSIIEVVKEPQNFLSPVPQQKKSTPVKKTKQGGK